ncbi:hypothetical protein F4804DRAFT_242093 [Jackrogersella minutella]|nr:hypothetical protein F4804DRAFT_242093 [Jackrogersella minutella]
MFSKMADHLALTHSGPSDSTMEGTPRLPKNKALNFAPPQNLAALEHIDMHIPWSTSRHPVGPYSRRIGDRLALWYQRNDGPWTPPGLTSPPGEIRAPAILNSLRAHPLSVFPSPYRESLVPSECDTVAPGAMSSDSGYGGSYGTKHSVANGSVCDESLDRNAETQSLVGHPIHDLHFQSYSQDTLSKAGLNPEASWSHSQLPQPSPSSVIGRQANPEGGNMCEICNKVLKTKSEFKKHKQRHEKPFKCVVKDCTRSEGFSTPNDLDRHIRSLHPDENATGNRYRCPVGACNNRKKIWPRADNFRAHMKRVHQKELTTDEDLDQYKFSLTAPSKDTSDPAHDNAVPELDRFNEFSVGDSNFGPDSWKPPRSPEIDLSTETSPLEGPSQAQTEEIPVVNKPNDESCSRVPSSTLEQEVQSEGDDASIDKQAGSPRPFSAQPSSTLDDAGFMKPRRSEENDSISHSERPDAKLANGTNSLGHSTVEKPDELQDYPSEPSFECSQPDRPSEGPTDIDADSDAPPKPRGLDEMTDVDLTDRNGLLKLLEKLRSSGVLGELGYKKEDPAELEAAKREPIRSVSLEHVCPHCPKKFGRRCELKKHEKRHLKPYGCTFQDCNKKFGSKNDWKRHENSQHYMLEFWRCDEKQIDESSEPCGKVLDRRELFKQHLGTCHHIKDPALLDTKLEKCRVGRNCEVRFWCGFCQEIIEVRKKGKEAWAERFNHIDDHYHGRNNQAKKEISDWKNEYSLNPRAESPFNDSEDCSVVSSTSVSSVNGFITRRYVDIGLEKQQVQATKQKRKRDDRCNEPAKRVETMEIHRFHCCQCHETMPVTSRQCTNYPCAHILCVECEI